MIVCFDFLLARPFGRDQDAVAHVVSDNHLAEHVQVLLGATSYTGIIIGCK